MEQVLIALMGTIKTIVMTIGCVSALGMGTITFLLTMGVFTLDELKNFIRRN